MVASVVAVLAILVLTFSVLFWNYTETTQRRLTKKQGVVLDHWGKTAPSDIDREILLYGGIVQGETILG